MQKSILWVIVLLLINVNISAQKKVKLFNGKNLKGWYAYTAETGKTARPDTIFEAENRMIRLYGAKAGYLMSKQVFNNFKLTVDFRWNKDTSFVRKSDKRNSGVMYLVPVTAADTLWPQGIQFQIKDGATGDFILLQGVTVVTNGKQTEAGRSVVVKRTTDATKPDDEWNQLIITVKNGQITQALNGKIVNEASDPSVKSGRILLQYEGYPIDFKNVVIEVLK